MAMLRPPGYGLFVSRQTRDTEVAVLTEAIMAVACFVCIWRRVLSLYIPAGSTRPMEHVHQVHLVGVRLTPAIDPIPFYRGSVRCTSLHCRALWTRATSLFNCRRGESLPRAYVIPLKRLLGWFSWCPTATLNMVLTYKTPYLALWLLRSFVRALLCLADSEPSVCSSE